jgi:very-short-patch-repair endonuclease
MIVARKRTTFASWHRQNRRRLLKAATPAERAFTSYLASRGFAFRQQQGFYTPMYRIADFYLPTLNLIVEIDGAYHDTEKDRIKDERFLRERGIRTLRLTNERVLSGRIPPLF